MAIEVDIDFEWGHVRALPFTAIGGAVTVVPGECKLCGWSMRNLGGNTPGDFTIGAVAAFVAAAAGSAALPASAAYVTGFDVTMAAIAAAAGGTVTLTGVVGGPYLYNFEGMVGAASHLGVQFNPPLVAIAGSPSIAIGAIVGGGAGNLSIYGMTDATSAQAQILDGGNILAEIVLPADDSDSIFLTDRGVHVYNEIAVNPSIGSVEGVIYARYRS